MIFHELMFNGHKILHEVLDHYLFLKKGKYGPYYLTKYSNYH